MRRLMPGGPKGESREIPQGMNDDRRPERPGSQAQGDEDQTA